MVVASPEGGSLPQRVQAGGALWVRWEASRGPALSSWGEAKRLAALISRAEPDLIHLHSSKAGLAGRIGKQDVPVVFQPHAWSFEALRDPLALAARSWERIAAGRVDTILCVSRSEKEIGLESGIRGPYEVIPNGVDLDRFRPAAAEERKDLRAQLDLPDVPLFLTVGRLSKQKGQDLLVEAWGAGLGEAHLAIVGGGPMLADLRARAAPSVSFPGSSEEVELWLRAADGFVLPSRWEGMSLALLEALATGLPCVAFEVAGAREAIGPAGTIVAVGDVAALREAIRVRAADPALRAREGALARERAVALFDINRTAADTADLYMRLLAAR